MAGGRGSVSEAGRTVGAMDDEADAGRINVLRGRGLRFILVDQIRSRRTMTVAEMVGVLSDYGYRLPGRASKVISDALRWELARGRVVRVARGVYAYGRAPQTTARRIRLFASNTRFKFNSFSCDYLHIRPSVAMALVQCRCFLSGYLSTLT